MRSAPGFADSRKASVSPPGRRAGSFATRCRARVNDERVRTPGALNPTEKHHQSRIRSSGLPLGSASVRSRRIGRSTVPGREGRPAGARSRVRRIYRSRRRDDRLREQSLTPDAHPASDSEPPGPFFVLRVTWVLPQRPTDRWDSPRRVLSATTGTCVGRGTPLRSASRPRPGAPEAEARGCPPV